MPETHSLALTIGDTTFRLHNDGRLTVEGAKKKEAEIRSILQSLGLLKNSELIYSEIDE